MSAEADVATELAANVGALTLGTNLRIGEVRPASRTTGATGAVPEECVFVSSPASGPAPILFRDGGAGNQLLRRAVQITVRSEIDEYANGLTLAESVWTGIHLNPPSGYIDAKARGSQPNFIGETDKGSYVWTINVDLTGGS